MKSVLLRCQIMFYSRICNSQAQLGTRDIQKLDFEKVVFNFFLNPKIYDIQYVTRAAHYTILYSTDDGPSVVDVHDFEHFLQIDTP